uniref:Uncharacterized protein n=1 Tax=Spironucleus salmonicida TaxID=348837 RepID=V6LV40_9EUKA|eukprot:EST48502.1 Hypothetical protein SS50377_11309 [Spironucleus salmonicida]
MSNYPNLNTPRISTKQNVLFTPAAINSPHSNTPTNDLLRARVDTPNTPQYGDKKVCMDISSPTLKQQYQNQQLVIQPGIQYQQQNIQPNQIMSIQNQSIHNQPIHSQNNIILTKISRPVLPSYHQKFYDSLNLDQKLQFFGGHVNQQTQNQKWNGEATILQLDIKSSSQEKLDSVKQQTNLISYVITINYITCAGFIAIADQWLLINQ